MGFLPTITNVSNQKYRAQVMSGVRKGDLDFLGSVLPLLTAIFVHQMMLDVRITKTVQCTALYHHAVIVNQKQDCSL